MVQVSNTKSTKTDLKNARAVNFAGMSIGQLRGSSLKMWTVHPPSPHDFAVPRNPRYRTAAESALAPRKKEEHFQTGFCHSILGPHPHTLYGYFNSVPRFQVSNASRTKRMRVRVLFFRLARAAREALFRRKRHYKVVDICGKMLLFQVS